jgi:hypothetical protein
MNYFLSLSVLKIEVNNPRKLAEVVDPNQLILFTFIAMVIMALHGVLPKYVGQAVKKQYYHG